MIEPAVSSALAARHADRVATLAMLMATAGREHELEGLYIAARLPMLQVMGTHQGVPCVPLNSMEHFECPRRHIAICM